MPGLVKCIERYICFYFKLAFLFLLGFLRHIALIFFSGGNIAKPFFRQRFYFFCSNISSNYHDRIYRPIIFEEEFFYIFQLCIFYVRKFLADGHPSIGMLFISQVSHFMPDISIRLGDIMFLELFYNNFALYFKAFFTE